MDQIKENEMKKSLKEKKIALGAAFGVVFGIIFGAAIDNVGLGIALGAGLGFTMNAKGKLFKWKKVKRLASHQPHIRGVFCL
jgi:hypothetical protein